VILSKKLSWSRFHSARYVADIPSGLKDTRTLFRWDLKGRERTLKGAFPAVNGLNQQELTSQIAV
jgi:hypothetical protein